MARWVGSDNDLGFDTRTCRPSARAPQRDDALPVDRDLHVQSYVHAAADLPVVIRSKKTSIGFQVPPIRNAPDNAQLQILRLIWGSG